MGDSSEEKNAVGAELRILLVEPDADTRSLLALALSARGHHVVIGSAAHDAFQAIEAESFPLIVIACDLPDLDASGVCRRLRSEPNSRDSTIIVLSERCEGLDRADTLDAGANDCLAWPADAMVLRTHLEAIERAGATFQDMELAELIAGVGAGGEAAIVLGRDGTIRGVSTEIEAWLQYASGDLIGVSAFTLLHVDDAATLLNLSTEAMGTSGSTSEVVAQFQTGSGDWRRLQLRAISRLDDPAVRGIVLLASTLEEAASAAVDVIVDPLRDVATGLASTALFMDRLDHALLLAQRRHEPIAMMVIDVDGGGELDQSFAAGVSDQVAIGVAERLRSSLRDGDTAGRLGPNEFGTLIEGIEGPDEALAIARGIVHDPSTPIAAGDPAHDLTLRVGIVLSWSGSGSAEDVLDQARLAHRSAIDDAQSGDHVALRELGEPLAPTVDDALPMAPVIEETPVPVIGFDPLDVESLWFSPLMVRIGNLEREIGRLNERRAAARMVHAG